MLVPFAWLKEFVPYEGSATLLGERLTMLGLELEGIHNPSAGLEPIVVGRVELCEKHPEADMLSVCKVNVGDEILDIVCGAPNVRSGLAVPVVKVGATLPNGTVIKKAKLRGVPSYGMICSEAELGFSEEHNGIMELPASVQAGSRLLDVLPLETQVLEFSVTPNRGDCLSVLGIARETALAFKLPLTLPSCDLLEGLTPSSSLISVEIEDAELCPMYSCRIMENAPAGPSPDWVRLRLLAAGIRPISNHVDVTNYILLELGQPLHAFDLDKVRGGRIIVKAARQNDRFLALNGQEYQLGQTDISICDAEGIIGLGGVMGGLNSEIDEQSRNVLIECAVFHPSAIRRTARRLNLHSEASYRFERGVDQANADYALNRAAQLMGAISEGSICRGIVKNEPKPYVCRLVCIRQERAGLLLGFPLARAFCEETFESLGCRADALAEHSSGSGKTVWEVCPPSHRHDLSREVDFIEELVRVYGVDAIPPVLPPVVKKLDQTSSLLSFHHFQAGIKTWASGLGLNEVINYSFVSHAELDFIQDEQIGRVDILNPLSDEMNVLRTELAPGLLQNLRTNIAHGALGIRLFEVATRFKQDASRETETAETARLGLLLYGKRYDGAWPQVQDDVDYFDLKGILEHLARHLCLNPLRIFTAEKPFWLSPALILTCGNTEFGYAGQVKRQIADHFHAKKAVWYAELDLDVLYALHCQGIAQFKELPIFPPIRRDITFICPPDLQAGVLSEAIEALGIAILRDVRLIDVYVPQGGCQRSLTFRLTFRHESKTLKDNEVDKLRQRIADAVCLEQGVTV